jgi:hypothetical protein
MTVFWGVTPCSLVIIDFRFRGAYCFRDLGDDDPDAGGSKLLWNVNLLLPDYTSNIPQDVTFISYSSP